MSRSRLLLGAVSLLVELSVAGARGQSLPAAAARARQSDLGQFMTPSDVSDFMAAMLNAPPAREVRLLDAGAGQGALSLAVARRWSANETGGGTLSIDAFELDPDLARELRSGLGGISRPGAVTARVHEGDFIAAAAGLVARGDRPYTHAILNPPYRKITSGSAARGTLSSVGIETSNLYSGFVALALKLLQDDGDLVAIIPRSFCNGPYFRAFRSLILRDSAIVAIHLFAARNKAFAADGVLQENVILHLRKGSEQRDVVIGTSTAGDFADLRRRSVPFDDIVRPSDPAQVIHVPTAPVPDLLRRSPAYGSTLAGLGLHVSTGPVVDFRVKRHLRDEVAGNDIPLLYPAHFSAGQLRWPVVGGKKPNALALNGETARLLFPRGFYVVTRRFSSKEEKRRVVASVVDPARLPTGWIAFENHLNVLHRDRGPLTEDEAYGLATYLNAKVVDDWFRTFSGHTQVNATDLKSMPMPSLERLTTLGAWSRKANPNQAQIDQAVADLR